ncbi:MAG: selenide, water dikinase SelD [Rhodospirillales bacterium]|nr:selenide, water dikinase SelD [Rhodospirillales bacterium]
MKASSQPVLKDLVLIGGGHAHVAVIKSFGMKPIPGVRLTIISRDVHTPYSGMLPGYVAGHYAYDDIHIDLRPLAQFAGARLYHTEVTGIDSGNKMVLCKGRPPVPYDVLSINIGSTPRIGGIDGASAFAVAVKPISRFVERWHRLLERVINQPGSHRIGVVGAGAAGVELVLAIQFRLQNELARRGRSAEELEFHLISKTEQIMPQFPGAVGRRFAGILDERRVTVHRGVEATEMEDGVLVLSSGARLELDETLFVTAAGAAPWLKDCGFAVDGHGFVKVEDSLQVVAQPVIFAAGDIAAVINHPRPKAGVFAVRQGKPLADNLRRVLLQKPPKPFTPQSSILALISSGDKYAVASKGWLTVAGKLMWTWKNWIDWRFMKKFTDLPEMTEDAIPGVNVALTNADTLKEISAIAMRCGGCGAKVGAGVLSRALSELKPAPRDDILIGLHDPDDAAVVEVPAGKVMVHTVDYFRSFIDDPYLFGKIAANHSLSDIFAMGGEAQSALAIATVPYGIESQVEATLTQMMAGAMEMLNDANAALVGGHTSEGAELALGFSVNGLADKAKIMRKGGMQAGNVLILTKALGTGTLFAADMQQKARGRWIDAALDSMIQSNRLAAECLFRHGATACTDVTGFGLLGHMVEMIRPSGVDVEITMSALPIMDGALETVRMGILSSLQPANVRLRRAIRNQQDAVTSEIYPLVFDPQTSGGLLASVPAAKAGDCVAALKGLGYPHSAIVGRVLAQSEHLEPVVLSA